ncbi:MAG: hypothetical protein ACMXX8_02590 [Candidatus Woesearchaeota archaeon]
MIKEIIVIIVAIFLFLLLWKLMKNVIKALIIVAILLLIFSGIIFVRDIMILRSISSDDTLIVLQNDNEYLLGIKNGDIIEDDFKTPYIVLNLDKLENSDEILALIQSDEEEAINLIKNIALNNIMSNLDEEIIYLKPEPYFMSILKGTFKDRIKEDASLVGGAIRSNIRNLTN